jgi:hypothetical protein
MDRKKLEKLQSELDQMRLRSVKAADLQSLAARLGRDTQKRGKHPMWVSGEFPDLFPLSIPDHGGGRDTSPKVKKVALENLQLDIDAWDAKLPSTNKGNGVKDNG